MHWSAVRLLTLAPEHLTAGTRDALVALLDERLTADAVAGRGRRTCAPDPTLERPYGWAWAATLAAAAADAPLPRAGDVGPPRWSRWPTPWPTPCSAWLPRLAHPVRHGVHSNTAFALALLHEAYGRLGTRRRGGGRRGVGPAVVRRRPRLPRPLGAERQRLPLPRPLRGRPPAAGAAGGRVRPAWLAAFLPGLGRAGDPLLGVPEVLDRTDGQAVHLVGLALSRAWQLRLLTPHLPPGRRRRVAEATERQTAAAAEETVSGDFMATHWLVSFALLAATAEEA